MDELEEEGRSTKRIISYFDLKILLVIRVSYEWKEDIRVAKAQSVARPVCDTLK